MHLLQALEALDAQSQQLLGLQVCFHPVLGWLEVPLTLLAPQQCDLLLDAFCDVHLGSYTVDAHVGRVRGDCHSTQATQPARGRTL